MLAIGDRWDGCGTQPQRRWRLWLKAAAYLVSALCLDSIAAPIYRCVNQAGQITLTDQPCPGTTPPQPVLPLPQSNSAPPSAASAASGPSPSAAALTLGGAAARGYGPALGPDGRWHGSANLLMTASGKPQPVTPQVGSVRFAIDAAGAIRGELREHGCQLAGRVGIAYDQADYAITLDASGCKDPNLDLSYTGTLQLGAAGQPSRLALSGLSGFVTGKNPVSASIRADLQKDTAPAHSPQ